MMIPRDFNAFILAAGEGRRLRPYTNDIPKPMVQVAGKPIIEHIFNRLKVAQIPHVTVNGNYRKDVLERFLQMLPYPPSIYFSREDEDCDTGFGVKRALHTMEDKPFYLFNGDAFWTESEEASVLERLAATWNPDKMDILLLLQPLDKMILTAGVGDYDLDENGKAIRSPDKKGEHMFAGIRICAPSVFEDSPDTKFGFLELMDKAERNGRLYGVVHDADWHHISTPDDLEKVNTFFQDGAA